MSNKLIFVTETEKYNNKKVITKWRVIWVLVAILFIAFVYRPDWFVVPPAFKFR